MFSNLSKGSILHGVDKSNGDMRWFTGAVERIAPSLNTQYANAYGQFPSIDLDIVANVEGKRQEFKGIHSSDSIADFGANTLILADTESALFNYIKSLLKASEDAVNEDNIKMHQALIPQYRKVLSDMRPGSSSSNEVRELQSKVDTLQSQLAEALALLKAGNTKEKDS